MQKGMRLIVALLLGVRTMKTGLCLSIRMMIDHTRWFFPTINIPFSFFLLNPQTDMLSPEFEHNVVDGMADIPVDMNIFSYYIWQNDSVLKRISRLRKLACWHAQLPPTSQHRATITTTTPFCNRILVLPRDRALPLQKVLSNNPVDHGNRRNTFLLLR